MPLPVTAGTGEEDARLRPLASLRSDIADHGLEGVAAHVGGELGVVEALGAFDRLGQDLSGRIAERRERPAAGSMPWVGGGLVFGEQLLGAGNVRLGAGRTLRLFTMPFVSGPSCALIGVTRSPMKAPPNILGVSPTSLAARMMRRSPADRRRRRRCRIERLHRAQIGV